MSVDLQNGDSSLLSSQSSQQFFTDENINILSQNTHNSNKHINQTWSSSSSCFGSSVFGSALSSPVESELGFTESESDQDDNYNAKLTRQMAHNMLQDDENRHEKELWSLASSHQSTQEEVPIRGKLENSKINEEKRLLYNNGERFFGTSLELNSVPLSMRKPRSSNLDFQSKQALIDHQIRAIQLYKLKQEQIMKQKQDSLYWGKQSNRNYNHIELSKRQLKQIHQIKGRACGGYNRGQQIPWANLQQKQRTGSDMTEIFLGDSGLRTRYCGTGVFLPRGIGKTCESCKKHGCSTVLIPAIVVQALKLHFEKMGIESRSNFAQQDVLTNRLQDQKKSQSRTVVPAMNHQEMGLPQEWTY